MSKENFELKMVTCLTRYHFIPDHYLIKMYFCHNILKSLSLFFHAALRSCRTNPDHCAHSMRIQMYSTFMANPAASQMQLKRKSTDLFYKFVAVFWILEGSSLPVPQLGGELWKMAAASNVPDFAFTLPQAPRISLS